MIKNVESSFIKPSFGKSINRNDTVYAQKPTGDSCIVKLNSEKRKGTMSKKAFQALCANEVFKRTMQTIFFDTCNSKYAYHDDSIGTLKFDNELFSKKLEKLDHQYKTPIDFKL